LNDKKSQNMENNSHQITYDIVIVLCPEERDKTTDRFPEYNKKDGSYLGGQTRMDAAVALYKRNKSTKFFVVGGLDKRCKTLCDSVKTKGMKDYLVEECGKDIVVTRINSLPCTRHNFIATFVDWKSQSLTLENKIVGILTNFYHLPRSFKFLGQVLQNYKIDGNPLFIPIAAESIVCQPEIYINNQEYLLTLKNEVQGMQVIEDYAYKDGCLLRKSEYERGKFEDYADIIKSHGDALLSEEDKYKLKDY
jgi:hypothetical protein